MPRIEPKCLETDDYTYYVELDRVTGIGTSCDADLPFDPGQSGVTAPGGWTDARDRTILPGEQVTARIRVESTDGRRDLSAAELSQALLGIGLYAAPTDVVEGVVGGGGVEAERTIERAGKLWRLTGDTLTGGPTARAEAAASDRPRWLDVVVDRPRAGRVELLLDGTVVGETTSSADGTTYIGMEGRELAPGDHVVEHRAPSGRPSGRRRPWGSWSTSRSAEPASRRFSTGRGARVSAPGTGCVPCRRASEGDAVDGVRPLRGLAGGLLALVMALGVAGCGEDAVRPAPYSEPPDPTSSGTPASPSPTGSSSPTQEPATLAWQQRTAAGAEAFARHWIATFSRVVETGDAEQLRKLSTDACTACRNFTTRIDDIQEAGGFYRHNGWRVVRSVRSPDGSENARTITMRVRRSAETYKDAAAAPVQSNPASVANLVAYVVWTAKGWRMSRLDLVS